jgi:Tfp pilus assembly protein PilF
MMQLDNARKSYERALKLKPTYVEAMNTRLSSITRRRAAAAISWYNKALKAAPIENRRLDLHEPGHRAVRRKMRPGDGGYQTAMQIDPDVSSATATWV